MLPDSGKVDTGNTYRKLFTETLRQYNRDWTKRSTKPVEYKLIGQNCVARAFTSVVSDMVQKRNRYETRI